MNAGGDSPWVVSPLAFGFYLIKSRWLQCVVDVLFVDLVFFSWAEKNQKALALSGNPRGGAAAA